MTAQNLHMINALSHYQGQMAPIEHTDLPECEYRIRNIGWTLGNDCPYRCQHCYSMSARIKGRDMEKWMVDRIVQQLAENEIETVNLGGNEPLFTNGLNPRDSLLPYIIEQLVEKGILVGLTTAGITLTYLEKHAPQTVALLNDIDVSLDSPYAEEHNRNRGTNLYGLALAALEIAQRRAIPHTIIMCGMAWNFTSRHLHELVELARRFEAHVRINPIKPVESGQVSVELSASQYFEGFRTLSDLCDAVDVGEPPLSAVFRLPEAKGCPCGRSSFRIHSITPTGEIPVSPCVYLHEYKFGNLLTDDLADIVRSAPFQSFRRRNANPDAVEGCSGCSMLQACRGGCAARSYLTKLHHERQRTLFGRDPYCPRDQVVEMAPAALRLHVPNSRLVHQDYLCTWIGKPRVGELPS
ncbi:MAG: radical SAM protein [Gemmataceae bacterium]